MSDLNKVMEGRRGIYALMATLFLEPPPRSFIEDLMKGEVAFFDRLNQIAGEFDNADKFEESIREEYSSLFIDPFQKTISLYQSTYEGESPYGKVTQRIAGKFKEFGYTFSYTEPADHIGVELFFMAESSKNASESDRSEKVSELRKQKKFLEEELGWVQSLVSAINESEKSHFYREVSNTLLDFLQKDSSLIDELIVEGLKS